MSISEKEIKQISEEALAALVRFKDMWTSRTPDTIEKTLVLIDENLIAIGTGPDESANSRAEFAVFLQREIEQMPDGLTIDLIQPRVTVLSESAASISSQAVITVLGQEELPSVKMRISTSLRKSAQGSWLISQWHTSIPWYDQAEGESVPLDAMKARAARLEKEVAERTIQLTRANRDLEVEASLERIRRSTGGMRDPSDLTDVLKQIRREVDALYGGNVLEVDLMREFDQDTLQLWSIIDIAAMPDRMEQFGLLYPKKANPSHPVAERIWATEGGYSEFESDLEELWLVHASLAHYVPHEAEMLKTVLDSGDLTRMWFSVSTIHEGKMFIAWGVKPPEDVVTVQPRIAAMLDEAQKRVEELQTANRREREAQIEAALERIRGRALAMRSSDELMEVAAEMRHQMALLGQAELEVCAVHLFDDDPDTFGSWAAVRSPRSDGEIVSRTSRFPRKGVRVLERSLEKFASDESDYVLINQGEEALEFFAMLKKVDPVSYAAISVSVEGVPRDQIRSFWSTSDFSGGSLIMVTYSEPDPDARDLLRRCAHVFDLAYRRYQDLKEAEVAAREARIETALERVRARSMAMHSSTELFEVAQVLFHQLIELGLKVEDMETCGFVIFKDGSSVAETFVTIPDGSTLGYSFTAEYGGDWVTKEWLEAWRSGKAAHMIELMGRNLPDHLDYLTEMSGQPINKFHEQVGKEMPHGSYNHGAFFEHGYVTVITTEPQDATKALYPRFAKVFGQVYTRFLDLKKAEQQAWEARVETAVERVRSRAMAMHLSEEMSEVAATMRDELQGLGIDLPPISWIQ